MAIVYVRPKPGSINSFANLQGWSIGGGVGVGFFSYQEADLAEILVDFAIGLEERSLVVGDVMRAAVVADDFLNLAEFVGGHSGKKVVFDLAGEAAGAEVNSGVVLDVAAGKHLFPEKIYRRVALLQWHALMIGREDQSEIQTEERLMSDDEENGVRPAEEENQEAEIPAGVDDQETYFEDGMRDLIALQETNAVVFQDKGLEHGQREKREVLVFHREAREAVLPCRLVFRECEGN